jgi:hypothetical protein
MAIARPTVRKLLVAGIIGLVLLAVLVVGVGILLKGRAEERFRTVEGAVNGLSLPAGAVANTKFNEDRGQGLDAYGCISTDCPFVRRVWFVPVASDTEEQVAQAVLSDNGYDLVAPPRESCDTGDSNGGIERLCTFEGRNGQLSLTVTLQTLGQEIPPIRSDPADGRWRLLQVDARLG